MTEEVFLTGASFNASSFPQWASEKTAQDMEKHLRDVVGSNKGAAESLKKLIKAVTTSSSSNATVVKNAIKSLEKATTKHLDTISRGITNDNKSKGKTTQSNTQSSEIGDSGSSVLVGLLQAQNGILANISSALGADANNNGENTTTQIDDGEEDKQYPLFEQLVNNNNDTVKKNDDAYNDNTESTETNTEETNKNSKKVTLFGLNVDKAAKSISKFISSMPDMLFTKLYDSATDVVGSYNEIYKNGLVLSSSFTATSDGIQTGMAGLAHSAMTANLNIAEMSKLSGKYSATLRDVGLGTFAEEVNNVQGNMAKFGVTSTDTANYLSEYLDNVRMVDGFNTISQRQAMVAAREQLETTVQFSQALGVSRDELEAQRQATMKSIDAQAALQALPDDMRRSASAAMGTVSTAFGAAAPEINEMIANLMTVSPGQMAANEKIQALMQGGQQGMATAFLNLAQGMQSGAITQENAAKYIQDKILNLDISSEDMQLVNQLAGAGVQSGEFTQGLLVSIKNMQNRVDDLSAKPLDDPFAEATVGMQESMKTFNGIFDNITASLLGNESVVSALSETAELITAALVESGPQIADSIQNLISMAGPAIATLASELPEIIDSVIGFFGSVRDFFGLGEEQAKEISFGDIFGNIIDMFAESVLLQAIVGIKAASLLIGPAVSLLFKGISSGINLVMSGAKAMASMSLTGTKTILTKGFSAVKGGISSLLSSTSNGFMNAAKPAASKAASVGASMFSNIASKLGTVAKLGLTKIPLIGTAIAAVIGGVSGAIDSESESWGGLAKDILGGAIKGVITGLTTLITAPIDYFAGTDLTGFVDDALNKAGNAISGWFGFGDDKTPENKKVDNYPKTVVYEELQSNSSISRQNDQRESDIPTLPDESTTSGSVASQSAANNEIPNTLSSSSERMQNVNMDSKLSAMINTNVEIAELNRQMVRTLNRIAAA